MSGPNNDDDAPKAPGSDARAMTPVPVPPSAPDVARERTRTPAAGRPLAPPPPPPDARRERARTPPPGLPGLPPPAATTAPSKPPTATAPPRTQTPAPGLPVTHSVAETAASAPPTAPAPNEPPVPKRVAPPIDLAAELAATPEPIPTGRERNDTPAPIDPATARERSRTPVRASAAGSAPKPRPALRAQTPLPTTPMPARRPSDPPSASERQRRASTDPPNLADRQRRASTPPPNASQRQRRASTDPATHSAPRSLPTASIRTAEPWAQRIVRIVPWVLIAMPALFQIFLLSTAITGRLLYPYDLEWMEGGMLHHAQRIHGGLGVYVPPSIEFIPYLYTPLYPSLLALFGGAFGLSYPLGRAFSVLALIGIAVVTAVSIANKRHQHARRAPAWGGVVIALGLFSAAYPFMEGWYDLVRADTFFLFMVTAAIAGLPRWAVTGSGLRGHGRVAAGAVLLALAFFCKQTGIIYVAFGGLIVLVVAWRRVPTYVAMAGLIGLGGTWLLERTTDGWFWIYIKEIHAAHDFNWDRFYKSFANILWHFPAMSIVIGAALLVVLITVIWRRTLPRATHPLLLWASTYAVSTLLGAIGWATEFAHFNAYMPAFLHGALAAGAAIPAVYGCVRLLWGPRKGVEIVASLIALAAAVPLAYACWQNRWDPQNYIPTERDVAAGDKLIARIAAIEGDVWMPSHPWYLQLAGKTPRAHRMGVKDVTWRQTRTVEGLAEALEHHAFAALILDGTDIHNAEPATMGQVNASYRAALKLPADERPRVYTGARVTPDSIWLPAIPATPPTGTRVLFDFEQVTWEGWTLSGPAWGRRPEAELSGHDFVAGATGRKLATSMHGGDTAVGRVTSPGFTATGIISIKIGGGTDATKLRVELWIAGAIVATAGGPAPGGETLRTVTLDPGASRGGEATIVLVDDSAAGHLDVDDVWITP